MRVEHLKGWLEETWKAEAAVEKSVEAAEKVNRVPGGKETEGEKETEG